MNRQCVGLFLGAIVLFCPAPGFADYDRALESYLKEDYIQAASSFDRLLLQYPRHPRIRRARFFAALSRLKLEQPKSSLLHIQTLLAESPDTSRAGPEDPSPSAVRLVAGLSYRLLGDDTAAMDAFEMAWLSAANTYERAAARDQIRDLRESPLQTVQAPPARPLSDLPDESSSWVVQAVSTPDRAQAEAIRTDLSRDGWPVYEESVILKGQSHVRVRIGPYPSESEAHFAKSRLQSKFGISGWVTKK